MWSCPSTLRLLISEPGRKPLSVLLQMLKQIASHKLGRRDHPRFLQTRYYDFPVCSFVHHATGVEGIVEIVGMDGAKAGTIRHPSIMKPTLSHRAREEWGTPSISFLNGYVVLRSIALCSTTTTSQLLPK